MMQEKLNFTPTKAAAIVGVIGVFNGLAEYYGPVYQIIQGGQTFTFYFSRFKS